jgi:hypothetical protein
MHTIPRHQTEEVTWPGKTGATHLEALKDLRESYPEDRSDTEYTKKREALKKAGEDVLKKDSEYVVIKPIITKTLADSLIKEKVCDPVVGQGDTFKDRHFKYKIVQVASAQYQMIDIEGGNRHSDIIVDANNGPMHLSDFLPIKFKLKEFTPCKVKVKVEVVG